MTVRSRLVNPLSATRRQLDDELRARGGGATTAAEWGYLSDEGETWVRSVGVDVLADRVEAHRAKRRRRRPPTVEQAPLYALGVYREARSVLLAGVADDDPAVRAFRGDVLGGRLLDPGDVPGWVAAQAERDGPPTVWLRVTTPAPDGWQPGQPVPGPIEPGPGSEARVEVLEWLLPDRPHVQHQRVAHGGVLDRLRLLSDHLARTYGWHPANATDFVLTGTVPLVSLVRVATSYGVAALGGSERRVAVRRNVVTLTVDPEVPPEAVAREYGRERAQLLGRRPRSVTERAAVAATWVAERPGASWRACWTAWNREHPEQPYPTVRAFRQAVRDATRRVLVGPRPAR